MYRHSDGESLDDLRRRIELLKESLSDHNDTIARLRRGLVVKIARAVIAGIVVITLGAGMFVLIKSKNERLEADELRERVETRAKREAQHKERLAKERKAKEDLKAANKAAREFNQKASDDLFEGAEGWIKKYAAGKGDPWCNSGLLKPESVDGKQARGDVDRLYRCHVRQENAPTIDIDCSPALKRCYKVQP